MTPKAPPPVLLLLLLLPLLPTDANPPVVVGRFGAPKSENDMLMAEASERATVDSKRSEGKCRISLSQATACSA